MKVSVLSACLHSSLLLVAAAAFATPPVIAPEVLEQQVLAAFPEITAAQAALEAAEGELKAARLLPDPVLEVGALHSRERLGAAAATRGLGAVAWEVPLPWSYRPGKAVAAAGVREAAGALARTQLEVRARVRALVVELAAAQERVDIVSQQHQLTAELAQLMALRVELGESRELERLRLLVELERVGRELQLAQAEVQALAGVLARLAGGLPASFRLEGRLGGSVPGLEDQDLVARALAQNPVLAEREAQVAAARARLSLVSGERSPTVVARWERSEDVDTRSQALSLSFRLPLWNANRGQRAAAAARLRQVQAELEASQREVAAAVRAAAERLRGALQVAERLRQTALPLAQRAQELSDFSLRQGETSLLDALDARRSWQAVALEELEARRQLHLWRVELESLAALPMGPPLGVEAGVKAERPNAYQNVQEEKP